MKIFPPIRLDHFPVHIFSVDSEILQGTQSGKLTGNITFLFLYNSLCMDTRSIIYLYIIFYVWTPDPLYFYILFFMYGHPIHHIDLYVWTPDPSYYSLYYCCMDTRSIAFDIWLMYGHPIHHLFCVLLMYGHPIHYLFM